MEKLRKLLFLLPIFFLCSCRGEEEPVNTDFVFDWTGTGTYAYSQVKDKTIFYSNIFGIDEENYYVYFFSKTCSHCNELKDFIIPLALERDNLYFVEACDQIVIIKDASTTIGLSEIDNFGILGYPSLVKIEEKIVSKNLAGINPIKNELTN